jgi:UDP:flavonoid glycosyltransferase YjiC (YdhE family)
MGEALEEVIDDSSYKDKAIQLQEEFAQLGGSKRAADIIEDMI